MSTRKRDAGISNANPPRLTALVPFTDTQTPRDQILAAAAELFFERGFTQTGMNAIGRRCGVSGPAIYTHFKGKDEILATLALEGVETMLRQADQPLDDPWSDIEHLVRSHVEVILGDRRLAGVYVTERNALAEHLAAPIASRLERYRARWIAALERHWPGHDHETIVSAANAAMGIAHSTVLWSDEALATPGLDDLLVAMSLHALSVLDDPT